MRCNITGFGYKKVYVSDPIQTHLLIVELSFLIHQRNMIILQVEKNIIKEIEIM